MIEKGIAALMQSYRFDYDNEKHIQSLRVSFDIVNVRCKPAEFREAVIKLLNQLEVIEVEYKENNSCLQAIQKEQNEA